MDNIETESVIEQGFISECLKELESTCPESEAVIITYKRDLRGLMSGSPENYINGALINAGFIPLGKSLDLTKISLNLYRTKDGYSHFYLSTIGINNQDIVGLPGTTQVPGRAYYGASWTWEKDSSLSLEINSNQGVDLLKHGQNEYGKNDLYAINTMEKMFKSMDPRNVNVKLLPYPTSEYDL
jgi:hypothetical protein